ncbi:MAG: hypothetical protein CMH83_13405 [Nocardioides sp.]|nr:hypothetical protein [Nocardioides sp.]
MTTVLTIRTGRARRLVPALALAASTALVSGCGADQLIESATEKAAERALEEAAEADGSGDVDIDLDGDDGQVSVTDGDGNEFVAGTGGDLPDDWPESVPVVDGDVITSSSQTVDGERTWAATVVAEGVDDVAVARDLLTGAGFAVVSETNTDTGDGAYAIWAFDDGEYGISLQGAVTDGEGTYIYVVGPAGSF